MKLRSKVTEYEAEPFTPAMADNALRTHPAPAFGPLGLPLHVHPDTKEVSCSVSDSTDREGYTFCAA